MSGFVSSAVAVSLLLQVARLGGGVGGREYAHDAGNGPLRPKNVFSARFVELNPRASVGSALRFLGSEAGVLGS